MNKRHVKILADFEQGNVHKPGKTLIVGSRVYKEKMDRRKLYADAVGVDMLAGEGVDVVANLEEGPAPGAPYAHVECMSVLEHSRRPWLLAANLQDSMEDGATIFVAVPFMWRVHGYPSDYWRFTPAGVRELFGRIDWQRVSFSNVVLIPEDGRVEGVDLAAWQHFPRTEVYAFGVKR